MKPCPRRHWAASRNCSARDALDTQLGSARSPAARCVTSGTSGTIPKLWARGSPQEKPCCARDSWSRRRRSGCRSQPRSPGSGGWCPPSLPAPAGGGQVAAAIPSVRRSPPFTGGAGALPAGQLRGAEVKVCKIASLGTGGGLSHRPNTARSPERRTKRVPLLLAAPNRAAFRLLSSGLPGTRAGPGRILGEH